MKVQRILLCGFFQTVCGVKHERIGLAHGENELTVALHGCRNVSATNCLFTLTSHRDVECLTGAGDWRGTFCLRELTALFLTNDLSHDGLLKPKEKFFHFHHFHTVLRKSQDGERRVDVLCKGGDSANRLFSRLWLGDNDAASTVSWSSPRLISLATASIMSAPEALQKSSIYNRFRQLSVGGMPLDWKCDSGFLPTLTYKQSEASLDNTKYYPNRVPLSVWQHASTAFTFKKGLQLLTLCNMKIKGCSNEMNSGNKTHSH